MMIDLNKQPPSHPSTADQPQPVDLREQGIFVHLVLLRYGINTELLIDPISRYSYIKQVVHDAGLLRTVIKLPVCFSLQT